MRSLLLVVMIALLPLRMWAAEGMAVRMAHEQAAAFAMPADCPMTAQAMAAQGSSDESPATPVSHCMACHLCAASACLPELPQVQAPAPTGPPAAFPTRFCSTVLAPDLRPPIA